MLAIFDIDVFQKDFLFDEILSCHWRSTVVLLDTGTSGTSGENFSEDADDGTRTQSPFDHHYW